MRRLCRQTLSGLVAIVLVATFAIPKTAAQTTIRGQECSEEYLQSIGASIINCSGATNQCALGNGVGLRTQDIKIFTIGDSITVGMTSPGKLLEKYADKGYYTEPTYEEIKRTPNGGASYVGPSIEATSGYNIEKTMRVIQEHSDDIGAASPGNDTSAAQVVVIALGTNPDANFVEQSTALVEKIREFRADTQILWVNTYFTAALPKAYTEINELIATSAAANNFRVIDIAAATNSGQAPKTGNDGLHYSAGDYDARATWLAEAVHKDLVLYGVSGRALGELPGNCVCPSGTAINLSQSEKERYESTWKFFLSKGLSKEAAAGFMGNLRAESGINPENLQNNAPAILQDGPEMPTVLVNGKKVPHPIIAGNFGYGIAQWTTVGRQQGLIDFAEAQGQLTGNLDVQLNFLWKELNERFKGVLAVLQAPGVTVQQASDEVLLRFEVPASVILPPQGDSTPEKRQASMEARGKLGADIFTTLSSVEGPYTGSPSCGNPKGGNYPVIDLNIDPENPDKFLDYKCAPGTIDSGIKDGYRYRKDPEDPTKTISERVDIQTCKTTTGTEVNAMVSGRVADMLTALSQAGFSVGAYGFRTMEEQRKTFHDRCGKDYPETTPWNEDDCSRPPVARPGYSNHQFGVALDISCNGQLIPESYEDAKNNECFKWLQANAGRYDFRSMDTSSSSFEGWHWSVDGR